MSKKTFKKRKNILKLNSVNYKFINPPIFAPPFSIIFTFLPLPS